MPSSNFAPRRTWRAQSAIAVVLSVAAVVAVLIVGPLPLLLALSDLIRDPRSAWEALVDGLLWSRLATTGLIAVATLALAIPIGLLHAWLIVRTDVPLRTLMLVLAPWPLFLPPLVHVVGWYGVDQFGIGQFGASQFGGGSALPGFIGIVLISTIAFTPLVTMLSMRALDQIGREHAETMRLIGGRRLVFVDEIRQTLPSALVGGALAMILLMGDFAVADFITSVGPKITVYGDTIYAHHLGQRPAAAAAAALPGAVIALVALVWALRLRRRLGSAIDPRFEPAPRLRLGAWRWALLLPAALWTAIGTVLPFGSLLRQAGSFALIREQAVAAWPAIRFTAIAGATSATAIVAIAIVLALLSRRMRRPIWLDLLVALPIAVPPLLYGVGLIRMMNRPGLDAIYLGLGAVVVAMVGRTLLIGMMPVSGAVERLDRAMDDAARLAGAGVIDRTVTVLLPLLRGPMLVAWCLSFCLSLRELDTLIMLRAGQQALTHRLYAHVVFARDDEVAALALILATVTVTPLLIVLLLLRRPVRFL